jgi:hypothetical protein
VLGPSRWKPFAIGAIGILTVLSMLAAAVITMLSQAPAYYRQVDSFSDEDRTAESRLFVQQSSAVFNQIENEPSWSGEFRESQVNAWLAGDFERKHGDLLPRGVSEPRVSFENGCVALAFQFQRGPVTMVISASGRMWLPESNYIAFELEGVRAGAMPIPAAYVIQTVSSAAESAGLDLEWKQHDGNPVALLRFGPSDEASAVRVDQVEIKDGVLRVAGRSRGQGTAPESAAPRGDSSDVSWNVQSPDSSQRK